MTLLLLLDAHLHYMRYKHVWCETYLLDPLLVLHSFPLEVLTCLPGVSEFRFVEVAAAPGSGEVLLQLPDGDLHLLQLSMVLLHTHTHTADRGQ